MLSKYIILFFLGITTIFYSQSTGYMGRRVLVGYGFHTSPAFFGATANNKTIIGAGGSAESGTFAFNTIHEGFLEFAASSKWMISFSTCYYKTHYDNSMNLSNDEYGQNYFVTDSRPNGYYDIRGLNYSLYFKYYGKRYVAPWGRYVMFGSVINTAKATYNLSDMNLSARTIDDFGNSYDKDTLISNFGNNEQDFMSVNLMLGFGRSRIIGNRIVVDYGCSLQLFSLLSSAYSVVLDSDDAYSRTQVTSSNYIELTAKKRMRGVNSFNVFLKVGILLF